MKTTNDVRALGVSRQLRALLTLLLLGLLVSPEVAAAGDQALLGKKFSVSDPDPADPSRRKLSFRAKDSDPTHTLSGDPSTPALSGGGVLQIGIEGGTPNTQTFVLPKGETSRGKPLWRVLPKGGFAYKDAKGEFGPVRSLSLKRSDKGATKLGARLRGRDAPLELAPAAPTTGAYATLTLGGGDRYCVAFVDGTFTDGGAQKFKAKKPASEGCPPLVEGDILALSYNVAGLPQGLSGSDPEVNMPLIAPLLNGYELVLLQESWKTPEPNPSAPLRVYHEILEAGSLHPFRSEPLPLPLGSDPFRPSALVSDGLNRFSDAPFEEPIRERWSTCHPSAADCLALKGFSVARTTLAPGVTVDVYNLHGEAGSDPEDEAARDAGVTQLGAMMQSHSVGRPIIVGGDFNLHTDEEPDATQYARLLAENDLSDVCDTLACPQPGRIDKFAFRSAGAVAITPLTWNFETDVFVREDAEPLSDHDALAVLFSWSVVPD